MGNASGRECAACDRVDGSRGGGGGGEEPHGNGGSVLRENHAQSTRVPSADLMVQSPQRELHSRSPLSFASQVPVLPLQGNDSPLFNQMQRNETQGPVSQPLEQGIPTLITWSYGGNNVEIEGSWDGWQSRETLQRSGKDHTILLVLSSGTYRYKFIVDGIVRYIPDLPYEADEMGNVVNLLDVSDHVPENCENAREFEAPPSPDSSYNQALPEDEDFGKEPQVVPPQLHQTILDSENSDQAASSSQKPQHVVLNHLFIEKGWASQSVVALGLSHRFQSKYVTVVLYKPLRG